MTSMMFLPQISSTGRNIDSPKQRKKYKYVGRVIFGGAGQYTVATPRESALDSLGDIQARKSYLQPTEHKTSGHEEEGSMGTLCREEATNVRKDASKNADKNVDKNANRNANKNADKNANKNANKNVDKTANKNVNNTEMIFLVTENRTKGHR